MLNKSILFSAVFAAALFTACSDDSSSGSNNTEQVGCTVSENKDGSYMLSCADGSELTLRDGKDGANGKDGSDGKDGVNGTDGKDGEKGPDGKNGADGANGTDGTNGANCIVSDTTDVAASRTGYKLVCGTELKGVVWNGINGQDGSDGQDGKDGKRGTDGNDGEVGLEGTSCTVVDTTDESANRSGYKLVCGTELKGVVWNGIDGKNGKKGDPGEKGETGAAGTSCTVADTTDKATGRTGYKLVCGEEDKGTVWNGVDGNDGASCTVEELSNGAGYKMLCGGDSVGAVPNTNGGMCGLHVYSLTTQICDTRDNQPYRIVTIGTQTWMAQNLNYETTRGSYCYNDKADNCAKYGRLYTWAAAMDSAAVFSTAGEGCGYRKTCTVSGTVRGICPEGWHLPSEDEWSALFTAVGGDYSAGEDLKSTTGWNENGNGTDSYGFGVLPAGIHEDYSKGAGVFEYAGKYTNFWSSTEVTEHASLYACGWTFHYYCTNVLSLRGYKRDGSSVRCIKD